MRSWFASWRDINIGTTTIIVMAREIEAMGRDDREPEARRAARILKARIQSAALVEGVQDRLHALVRKHVDPKGD